ncbi:MAG: PilZ domain-containing protein [Deltaproteobacteria bacterium]|nr:PilZ domain-containing protein [Deltaproteobacteria bacterium]
MMDSRGANRRRHFRSRVVARCWIERENVTLFGRVVDLGEGGLFLRTAVVLPPGTDVNVHLRPAGGGETIRARGTVAWVGFRNDGDGRTRGLGIAFDRIEEGEPQLHAILAAAP